MSRTRDEFQRAGVLLEGKVVPEWFRGQCDGCSVPWWWLRWLMNAELARPVCVIHDYEYYLASLSFEPGQAEWAGARAAADFRLRKNRAQIARNRVVGWFYSRSYWIAVRFWGRAALWKRGRALPTPPNLDALRAVEVDLGILTERSRLIVEAWTVDLATVDTEG